MMTGDVAGAFHNIALAASFCGSYAGNIPELSFIVINLWLPFGWTDSRANYWLAGLAIKLYTASVTVSRTWRTVMITR